MLSVKEEKMIREGTRGAEGKQKGNEKKEFDQQRRRLYGNYTQCKDTLEEK